MYLYQCSMHSFANHCIGFMAGFVSATHHFHSVLLVVFQPLMGLFLLIYMHSLLLLISLRLDSFLFIAR